MTFRDEYKLFHRLIRRFDLRSSLEDIWRYSLYITEHQPLPTDYAAGKDVPKPLNELVFGWDLDLLARELVLNATRMGTRSLRNWTHLAGTIDHLRRPEDSAFLSNSDPEKAVMLEVHRLAHRQFPWQTDLGVRPMVRALKVFGEASVDAVVNRELGMTMRQFMTLGLAVSGNFLTNWGMSTNQDFSALGISRDASDVFFKRITCTMEELKAETARRQSLDRHWPYTWNPLECTPLVRYDPNFPDCILCPIPRYLTRRVAGEYSMTS